MEFQQNCDFFETIIHRDHTLQSQFESDQKIALAIEEFRSNSDLI